MHRFHLYLSNKILSFRPTELDPTNPNHRKDKTPARRGSFMCCRDVSLSLVLETEDETLQGSVDSRRGNCLLDNSVGTMGKKTTSTARWVMRLTVLKDRSLIACSKKGALIFFSFLPCFSATWLTIEGVKLYGTGCG
ncbi:hypothetical protein NPIL_115321 [Nephila pilipes]|uniref:Uncharacterized protein n=1 Tax=Nephila pilipes TaxID=299642 RepID=A0A8X6PA03_NEPPI|nr:hypothetical protein NPIL_115321 [Nephila pilipes]